MIWLPLQVPGKLHVWYGLITCVCSVIAVDLVIDEVMSQWTSLVNFVANAQVIHSEHNCNNSNAQSWVQCTCPSVTATSRTGTTALQQDGLIAKGARSVENTMHGCSDVMVRSVFLCWRDCYWRRATVLLIH